MYEDCPEAHAYWTKAEAGKAKSNRGEGVTYVAGKKHDVGADEHDYYRQAAHTSWQAHLQRKCSCRVLAALEEFKAR